MGRRLQSHAGMDAEHDGLEAFLLLVFVVLIALALVLTTGMLSG